MAIMHRRLYAGHVLTRFSNPVKSSLNLLEEWVFRARSRRYLAEMDQRLLKDIGMTEADRVQEIGKPFWRN